LGVAADVEGRLTAGEEEVGSEIGVIRLTERARVMPLLEFKSQCEKEYIEMVLQRTNWNVSRAAELLDIQRTHLHHKITTLGIKRPERTPV
jgi:DNA-binding NtrC family response regulator